MTDISEFDKKISVIFNKERTTPDDFEHDYDCFICDSKNYNPNLIQLQVDAVFESHINICKACLSKMIQLLNKTFIENIINKNPKIQKEI